MLVADDHKIMRQGLLRLLREESDIEIVGEAADGQAAIELALRTRPDVVVMDVSMPHCNGIDATRGMIAELPDVRVIGLSMYQGESMAALMRDVGAAAYLSKDAPPEALLDAIRGIGTSP